MDRCAWLSSPKQNTAKSARALKLDAVVRNALMQCSLDLAGRSQRISLDRLLSQAGTFRDPAPLVELFSAAIREVAALSQRNAEITIGFQDGELRLVGASPLELPDAKLQPDERLARLARDCGFHVSLAWDHGYGPVLLIRPHLEPRANNLRALPELRTA